MKYASVFGCLLFLACGFLGAKSQDRQDTTSSHGIVNTSQNPNAEMEGVPGVSLNNIDQFKDSLKLIDSTFTFEVFFDGSACREIRYAFGARLDTLMVSQVAERCVRTKTGYGVRGKIRNIKPGKYQFVVKRQFGPDWFTTVFHKEIMVP